MPESASYLSHAQHPRHIRLRQPSSQSCSRPPRSWRTPFGKVSASKPCCRALAPAIFSIPADSFLLGLGADKYHQEHHSYVEVEWNTPCLLVPKQVAHFLQSWSSRPHADSLMQVGFLDSSQANAQRAAATQTVRMYSKNLDKITKGF